MYDKGYSWIVLAGLLILALCHDMVKRRIPNWLVIAGLVASVACSLAESPENRSFGLWQFLLGALAGLALMLPLYFMRAMGAGDAKLMAVVGAFLGPLPVTGAVLMTFLAGGILSLLAAMFSGSLSRVLANLRLMGLVALSGRASGISMRDIQTTGRLPYAVAIAVGTGLQLWLAGQKGWPFV